MELILLAEGSDAGGRWERRLGGARRRCPTLLLGHERGGGTQGRKQRSCGSCGSRGEAGSDPSVLGDDSLNLDRARLWVIGFAWKSRQDLIWVGAVGLVEETREGVGGCGLDPDEESGGGG